VLIGMDTPQVTPELLALACERLVAPGVDAVLGAAPDGGYWALGLHEARSEVLYGVPMSADDTCVAQRERLLAHGLRVRELPPLRDVDDIADAHAVASAAPGGRFARTLAEVA
jgi:uncharacterized protein